MVWLNKPSSTLTRYKKSGIIPGSAVRVAGIAKHSGMKSISKQKSSGSISVERTGQKFALSRAVL